MVSVEEASRIIFSSLFPSTAQKTALEDSVGRVLAEPVYADRAFPPFDRVAMDGVAIVYETWKAGNRKFPIEGIQGAGEPQKTLADPLHCMEVMTGAVLPNGTDTVIRYEDLDISDTTARVNAEVVLKGQNVHRKGTDAQESELLLKPGIVLSPAEIALLASVGKSSVDVYASPRTAIISSGDELVAVNESPLSHQIRRSNVYSIAAAMRQIHWAGKIFHLPDNREFLEKKLKELLSENDVLILSGGVSKGKFDFIPEVLNSIGVSKLFHQVNQRPGKPFWFGTSPGKTVFALPGNPVSTFMCFYKYIRPWLLQSMGVAEGRKFATLKSDVNFSPKLTFYLQVNVHNENGKLIATPDVGGGSGDFANLKDVTGFLELPADRNTFYAGETYPYIEFRL
jgi:molybdopterin molybdotransferase